MADNASTNSLDAVLNFAGEIPGGPLRSVSGMQNEVGTLHYAGRYFQLTLTNGSNVPWNGIILNIATDLYPELHGDLDGVSFGLNFGPDPIVNYSSSAFSHVERLPVDFFSDLSFSGGTLLPGQSTTLLFALTDDGYGQFRGPYLGYRLSISAETPEPSTVLLFAVGLAVILASSPSNGKTGAPHQIGEARIGTQAIIARIHFQKGHRPGTVLVAFLQLPDGVVFLAEAGVDPRDEGCGDVSGGRHGKHLGQDATSVAGTSGNCIGLAHLAQRTRVVGVGLDGGFILFNRTLRQLFLQQGRRQIEPSHIERGFE